MRAHRLAVAALGSSGLAALALAVVWPNVRFLVLFGALDRLEGPLGLPFSWHTWLPLVIGGLGIVALAAAAGWATRPRVARRLAWAVAILLAVGTAYLLAWVLDPPDVSISLGVGGFQPAWPVLVALAALGAATASAVALALRR